MKGIVRSEVRPSNPNSCSRLMRSRQRRVYGPDFASEERTRRSKGRGASGDAPRSLAAARGRRAVSFYSAATISTRSQPTSPSGNPRRMS